MVTGEQPAEDVRTWFYAQVVSQGLARTDCSEIFRAVEGKLHCHRVREPGADCTRKQVEEYLAVLIIELEQCENCKG